jgi:hypothetical protein
MKTSDDKKTGLELLRQPFLSHQISKLPKPTKAQTDEIKADFKKGIRCKECGGWHHKDVIHLDYVGHAALTDRLLDCDPMWNWEPASVNPDGSPKLDANNGLWIKLTVCGITRMGYGHADGKVGGDAIKETIGDALRNAAMRFGAALDLWHKGDLHLTTEEDKKEINVAAALAGAKTESLQVDKSKINQLYANQKYETGINAGRAFGSNPDYAITYLGKLYEYERNKKLNPEGAQDKIFLEYYLGLKSPALPPKKDESEKVPF